MIETRDFGRLRWQAVLCAFLCAAGAGLVWWSTQACHRAEAERLTAEKNARTEHLRLVSARSGESRIRNSIAQFRQLEASGIAGPEHRLDWIERLNHLRDQLAMHDVRYTLHPRQPLAQGSSDNPYYLAASNMDFHASLVEELDLLTFLHGLADEPTAIVRPRGCSLKRTTTDGGEKNGGTTIEVDCQLAWITIAQRSMTP